MSGSRIDLLTMGAQIRVRASGECFAASLSRYLGNSHIRTLSASCLSTVLPFPTRSKITYLIQAVAMFCMADRWSRKELSISCRTRDVHPLDIEFDIISRTGPVCWVLVG